MVLRILPPVLGLLLLGCPAEPPPPKDRAPTPVVVPPTPPADAAAARQLLGRWTMDLRRVPESSLTEPMRKLKQQGKAGEVDIKYIITDNQFVVIKKGAGGDMEQRWHYEIKAEVDNRVELERTDDKGNAQRVAVTVRDPNTLVVGTGTDFVVLTRVP